MTHSTFVRAGTLALAVLAVPFAATADEKPLAVTIGGYFEGYMAGVNQDSNPGSAVSNAQPGYGVKTNGIFRKSRIQFEGRTNLDNGTHVGFRIQLRGESNQTDQIDQSYIFIDNLQQWGEVRIGKTRGAAWEMNYHMPYPQDASDSGFSLNGAGGDFNGLKYPQSNMVYKGSSTYISTYKYEKIVYYTPRFAGFQLGITYAPDGCVIRSPSSTYDGMSYNQQNIPSTVCGGNIGNSFDSTMMAGQQNNIWDAGLNYVFNTNGFKGGISLGVERGAVEYQPGYDNGQFRNHVAWNAGFNVSYAGFDIGGGYAFDNMGTQRAPLTAPIAVTYPGTVATDNNNWNIGIAYTYDRWRVGLQYAYANAKAVNSSAVSLGKDSYQGVGFGGAYKLGPGISLTAGAQWQSWTTWQPPSSRTYASAENQGWVYQAGTVLRF